MSVKPLYDHYSFTTPASVFDEEAITALELAGRTAAKVNETVRAFNEHEAKIDDRVTAQDNAIAYRMQLQDQKIDHAIDNTIPATVKADVDKHIQNGAFDKQISDYAGDLEGRLDNLLGTVSEGSTTLDAEVIDARMSWTGKTVYPNTGEAIREQVKELHHKHDEIFKIVTQLYNPLTVIANKYVGDDGALVDGDGCYVTHFIPVQPGKTYCFYRTDAHVPQTRAVAFYDESYNFISRSAVLCPDARTCFTGSNIVGYVRYEFSQPDLPYAQFFECDEWFYMPDTVYPYGVTKILNDNVIVAADSVKNPLTKDDVDFIVNSNNILNPATITEGSYIKPTNIIEEAYYLGYTDYIPVKTGDVFCITRDDLISGGVLGCFYDVDKNLLGGINGGDGFLNHYTFTVPKACEYIRVNVVLGKDYMLTRDSYPETYEPYKCALDDGIDFSDKQKAYIEEKTANAGGSGGYVSPLEGKTLYVIGDSICSGAGYAGGYGKVISDQFNMPVINAGIGGGTIGMSANTGSLADTFSAYDTENTADYVILEGGVNDAAQEMYVDDIGESYVAEWGSTFTRSLELMLESLINRYKGKKYGFLIPHQMLTAFKTGGYYDMILKCCAKWGVPVLDLTKEVPPFGMLPEGNELRTTYTKDGDGWHPNEECYRKYYAPKIVAWLESL